MSETTLAANKALVRAHYDAVTNAHDPDAIRQQVADDFFDHAAGKRLSAEEVIAHSRMLHGIFAELGATLHDMVAEDDRVAVRATWHGVQVAPFRGIPATGRRVSFTGMTWWRIAQGRIAERWAEIDFAGLEAQLRAQDQSI